MWLLLLLVLLCICLQKGGLWIILLLFLGFFLGKILEREGIKVQIYIKTIIFFIIAIHEIFISILTNIIGRANTRIMKG